MTAIRLIGPLKAACSRRARFSSQAATTKIVKRTVWTRCVHTWKSNWGPEFENDRPSRVTWELTPMGATTLLRMTHDDFDGETVTYQSISQGWAPILNSLKSFIETGEALNLAEIG